MATLIAFAEEQAAAEKMDPASPETRIATWADTLRSTPRHERARRSRFLEGQSGLVGSGFTFAQRAAPACFAAALRSSGVIFAKRLTGGFLHLALPNCPRMLLTVHPKAVPRNTDKRWEGTRLGLDAAACYLVMGSCGDSRRTAAP